MMDVNASATAFMRDLERRYREVSKLEKRSDYKIFFSQVRPADILVLCKNPGATPASIDTDGTGTGASESGFYENGELDILDNDWWPESRGLLKLLDPLFGGDRDEIRRRVVKSNMAFRRSGKYTDIDGTRAMNEAAPFLAEIINVVRPKLVLLGGVKIDEFALRYCDSWTSLSEPLRGGGRNHIVFSAAHLNLRGSGHKALGVHVAHPSQWSWTYQRYNVVEQIRALANTVDV
jgi:hypothetical protein